MLGRIAASERNHEETLDYACRCCSAAVFAISRRATSPETRGEIVSRRKNHHASRWLVIAIFVQSRERRRADFDVEVCSYRMVLGERPHNRGCGAGEAEGVSRPRVWNESAKVTRHGLPDWREFLEYPHAAGQPVHGAVVVSEAIHDSRKFSREDNMARFWRHQLSREHFPQRKEDSRKGRGGGCVANL